MKKIYYLFLITCSILLTLSCSNKVTDAGSMDGSTSTIYLVRHAEKADDGTRDPALTAEGNARAKRLSEMMKDKNINQVFSSDYKRTRQTAIPTATMINGEVQIYNPRDLEGFAKQLGMMKGQNILVVGHSNSTPSLANAIMGDEIFTAYEETEYSNIISITRRGENKYAAFSLMR